MGTDQRDRTKTARDNSRLLAMAILGGLVVLFAALNTERVDVNWVFGTWRTPLIVVIAVSVLLGLALGTLLARRRARR